MYQHSPQSQWKWQLVHNQWYVQEQARPCQMLNVNVILQEKLLVLMGREYLARRGMTTS